MFHLMQPKEETYSKKWCWHGEKNYLDKYYQPNKNTFLLYYIYRLRLTIHSTNSLFISHHCNRLFFFLTLSAGPLVLCDGICKWRRPDVSDTAIAEVWRGSVSFLRRWSHLCSNVLAPSWSCLQVSTVQLSCPSILSETVWPSFLHLTPIEVFLVNFGKETSVYLRGLQPDAACSSGAALNLLLLAKQL